MSSSHLKVYSKKLSLPVCLEKWPCPHCVFLEWDIHLLVDIMSSGQLWDAGHTGDVHRQWDTYRALSWPSSGSGHLRRRWSLKWLWQCLPWLPDAQRKKDVTKRRLPASTVATRTTNVCWVPTRGQTLVQGQGHSSDWERWGSCSLAADVQVQPEVDSKETNKQIFHQAAGGEKGYRAERGHEGLPRGVAFRLRSDWQEAADYAEIWGKVLRAEVTSEAMALRLELASEGWAEQRSVGLDLEDKLGGVR